MTKPQTYFHVGYARAASTFLQKTVFPALTGIQYIPRNRFRVREREKRRFRGDKILMSREAGQYIYQRCDDVLRIFDSKIIISLRRHDRLAGSLYRLQAKNGHTIRFPHFLDVENDKGTQKIREFEYMELIRYLQDKTGEPPLVLIFEDYLSDPQFYMQTLCTFLDCGVDEAKLDHRPVHKSYSDKQLRLRRQLSDLYLSPEEDWQRMTGMTLTDHNWKYTVKHRLVLWSTGLFMRLARFAPESWLNDEPLIEPAELEKVKHYYAEDWQACQQYVAAQAERLGVQRTV
ncbi:MAG: hypothetical protein HKN50_07885 [Gammaproteobacteria bacterium]|nr:hypothetical protein [Gammaproteobacteria bacterium]